MSVLLYLQQMLSWQQKKFCDFVDCCQHLACIFSWLLLPPYVVVLGQLVGGFFVL